jgi:YD repeat-containing protein
MTMTRPPAHDDTATQVPAPAREHPTVPPGARGAGWDARWLRARTLGGRLAAAVCLAASAWLAQAAESVAPLTRLQLHNSGWMEHTAGVSPIYANSIEELPQLACGSLPVASFVPHPTVANTWYYDCAGDPWWPFLMWISYRPYCPDGYQLSDGECVRNGEPSLEKACGTQGGCGAIPTLIVNPVNAATGNKVQVERDYRGAGPFPLRYERYYNGLPTSGNYLNYSGLTTLGYNWRSTYDRRIELITSDTLTSARVTRADGRVVYFTLRDGAWAADADVRERLAQLTDGAGNVTGWRLTTAADEVETYDAQGNLTAITQRGGSPTPSPTATASSCRSRTPSATPSPSPTTVPACSGRACSRA